MMEANQVLPCFISKKWSFLEESAAPAAGLGEEEGLQGLLGAAFPGPDPRVAQVVSSPAHSWGAGTSRGLPSARVGGPAPVGNLGPGKAERCSGPVGRGSQAGGGRGAPSPQNLTVLRATSSSWATYDHGHVPVSLEGGLLSGGKPLPLAEQLGYLQLVRGMKAGCTQFIRALVKQKSPPDKGEKKKRGHSFTWSSFGSFPCPW